MAVFRYKSSGFNRSKYLALYTIRELEQKGYTTGFEMIYVNSSVCYRGLICGLSRCVKWDYIRPVMNMGQKEYRISFKGIRFLNKLDRLIPDTVGQWLCEYRQWHGTLPQQIDDWRRPALVKLLEQMRFHRKGHTGTKRTREKRKSPSGHCRVCNRPVGIGRYQGYLGEYCPHCKLFNVLPPDTLKKR